MTMKNHLFLLKHCMNSSLELFKALNSFDYPVSERDEYWWNKSGTFEVVVGAILTQQTKWENVEKSLLALEESICISLESIVKSDIKYLGELIKSSGFYNRKAKYLKLISKAILDDFVDFEIFKDEVSREWLLSQKGIGQESADSILCYACYRDILVIDSYTDRILRAFGYEFESYDEIQEWMSSGIYSENLCKTYALYHANIVEYAKRHIKGKNVDIEPLKRALSHL